MNNISYPSAIETATIIDNIRAVIGRPVTFTVVDSTAECPTCALDPNTGTSVDSFCPTCSGEHYIKTYSGVQISGHVTWKDADDLDWHTGGKLLEGDCRVQIKYSTENLTVIDNTVNVTVDGRVTEIDKKIFRGVPTLNRVILLLREVKEDG